MMSGKKKIFTYSVLQLIIGFLAVPLYLKIAGKDFYGIYMLFFMPILAVQIFDFGVSKSISILAASIENDRRFQWLLCISLTSSLVLSLLYAILAYLAINVNDFLQLSQLLIKINTSLIVAALALPIIFFSNNLMFALEGKKDFDFTLPFQFFVFLSMHVGGILGFLFWDDINSGIISALTTRAIGQLIFIKSVLKKYDSKIKITSVSNLKSVIKYSKNIGKTNLFSYLIENVDKYMIATLLNPGAAAIYMVAMNIITKARLIPEAICKADFPIYASSSEPEAIKRNEKSTWQIVQLVTGLLALFAVLQEDLFQIWLQKKDVSDFTILTPFFLIAVYINSIAYPSYSFFEARGQISKMLEIYFLTAPVYFMAIWYLIHVNGSSGAALAWSTRLVVDSLLLMYIAKQMSYQFCLNLITNSILLFVLVMQPILKYDLLYKYGIFVILFGVLYYGIKKNKAFLQK